MTDDRQPTIKVQPDGPYVVSGSVPLRNKRPIVSEHGEPMTWQADDVTETKAVYLLCRCGLSSDKPFCDGTHTSSGFDGTEAAPTDGYQERTKTYPGVGITVVDDRGICEHAEFCTTQTTNVWKMTADTEDSIVRAQVMAMIERCPSGALSFLVDGVTIEPDLAIEVSAIDDGPLWVTGGIPVERADGESFETRNRVTLCRCGGSAIKPLCDGTHKKNGFRT